jgi:arylsulfatase A-like enzyme
MTGEADLKIPLSFDTPMDLEAVCKMADKQLGRILDGLKKKNLFDRTLIVLTADHGGQSDTTYLGNGEADVYGPLENDEPEALAFFPKRVVETKVVRMAVFDSALRFWLSDHSTAAEEKVLKRTREISGVVAIYLFDSKKMKYRKVYENMQAESKPFKSWAQAHYDELVDSESSDTAPDLIALLKDNVGFDRIGDHGGAQERVQRIPMLIFNAKQKGAQNQKPTRLVDLRGKILDQMGLKP